MKISRVLILFAYAFSSIGGPVILVLLVGILTYKPPYATSNLSGADQKLWQEIVEDVDAINSVSYQGDIPHLDEIRSVYFHFPNKGRVVLIEFPQESDMTDRIHWINTAIPTSKAEAVLNRYISYQRSDNNFAGELFFDDNWAILAEASSRQTLARQMEKLPLLKKQQSTFLSFTLGNIKTIIFGLILYSLLQVPIWCRMGSWAGSIERKSNTSPVPQNELYKQLLALNDQDNPFSIQPGKHHNELVVEWKYADAKWLGLMSAEGLKSMAKIKLRLDEGPQQVRTQDTLYRIRWHASAQGAGMHARLSASWFRGIAFAKYDLGFIGGFIFQKDGKPTLSPGYSWKFNIDEMKHPLIRVITEAGWDWRPVITFIRWING